MKIKSLLALALASTTALAAPAFAEGTIKIAVIEPLSGPLAANGGDILERFQFLFGRVNDAGGVLDGQKFEVIGLDNGWDVEKTAQQMQRAADEGVDYVINGIGPQHATAITNFIRKHNRRKEGEEMAFLAHTAGDNEITPKNCDYYQAVFDPTVEMKLNALILGMQEMGIEGPVFTINPDFSFGQTVDASFKELAGEAGIEIVGSEMIAPFGQVQDFTPLVARIKASGAKVVMTGNFGPDLIRLLNASVDSGLDVRFATLYGPDPSTMAAVGADKFEAAGVIAPFEYDENDTGGVPVLEELNSTYRDVAKTSWGIDRYRMMVDGLVGAIEAAGSAEPSVAMGSIGGVKLTTAGGEGFVRAEDNQMIIPYFIIGVDKAAPATVLYKGDDIGFGWRTEKIIPAETMALEPTCEIEKP